MSKSKKKSKSSKSPKKETKKEEIKEQKPEKKSRRSSKPIRTISVDLWKTGLHSAEIGIKRKETLMSKSRQFTKNMDLIGEIKEDNKKDNGFVAVNQGIKDERLVVKAFSGSMSWMGTIEESISAEVSQSLALNHNFPAFALIIDDYEYVLALEKVFGGPGQGERHHFTIYDEKDKTFESFTIKEKRLAIGDDWNITDAANDVVAEIDGKKFDIGGQWDLKIFNDELAKENAFVSSMILFCASRRYHKDIEDRIGKIIDEKKKGNKMKLDYSELQLHKNPRLRK
ncbi:MAG: hypothetical protein ACW981_18630 [Candidatus Hodarchaeales archaeon]|jgi:hypothetical protein